MGRRCSGVLCQIRAFWNFIEANAPGRLLLQMRLKKGDFLAQGLLPQCRMLQLRIFYLSSAVPQGKQGESLLLCFCIPQTPVAGQDYSRC